MHPLQEDLLKLWVNVSSYATQGPKEHFKGVVITKLSLSEHSVPQEGDQQNYDTLYSLITSFVTIVARATGYTFLMIPF